MQKIKVSDYGYTMLQIETSSCCDMNCTFCPYPLRKNKGARLSSDEVYTIIDSLDSSDDKFEYICFSQFNEPLLDNRIFEFIKYAKDKGFKVLIATNCLQLRNAEIRTKLIVAEPNYIKMSVQTLNNDIFTRCRGVNYSFEDYKEGIFEFLSASLKQKSPTLITIDIACNFLHKKEKMLRSFLGLEHGDPSVPSTIEEIMPDLTVFLNDLHNYDYSFKYSEKQIITFLETSKMHYENQQPLILADNIRLKVKEFLYGRRLVDFYPAFKSRGCAVRVISVLGTGSVVPCCLIYDDKVNMGNIKERSLNDIIEAGKELIIRIREGKNMPFLCRKCRGAPTKRGAITLGTLRYVREIVNAVKRTGLISNEDIA